MLISRSHLKNNKTKISADEDESSVNANVMMGCFFMLKAPKIKNVFRSKLGYL